MAAIDNLADAMRAIQALVRRVERLENNTNQNRSAIGRGGMSVYDGGMITIENGGLKVTGSAEIIGTLNANGTINMTGIFIASGEMQLNGTTVATGDFHIDGPLMVDGNTTFNGELNITGITNITGDTTVTGKLVTDGPVDINGLTKITGDVEVSGAMDVTGDLTVSGELDITGPATLNSDLTVATGKKITLGGLTLENTGNNGGAVNFPNGSVSSSATLGMLIASAVRIELAAPTIKLSGLPQATGVSANLYMDNNGVVREIV
ncbi:polymer-forming cytoskeletal protein [Arthrobacter sp. D5-1]|uniref:polymer-forming cytoskeletal protein n=1 Tax=Arthrobacter sp. D5-1 TaxID=1477518 RepID=UPI001A999771|nr:polymer-forming cytoskeletal protein [Arthrobacter sp. D5-1]QSZ49416.1 hypothetical protein AYX22_14085 [Arthrobacter sp. D5-1]